MRRGVNISDFKLGELVLVRRASGGHVGLAYVTEQPEQFKQNHAADDYVWVKFIHDGSEDGWLPYCVYALEEEQLS